MLGKIFAPIPGFFIRIFVAIVLMVASMLYFYYSGNIIDIFGWIPSNETLNYASIIFISFFVIYVL